MTRFEQLVQEEKQIYDNDIWCEYYLNGLDRKSELTEQYCGGNRTYYHGTRYGNPNIEPQNLNNKSSAPEILWFTQHFGYALMNIFHWDLDKKFLMNIEEPFILKQITQKEKNFMHARFDLDSNRDNKGWIYAIQIGKYNIFDFGSFSDHRELAGMLDLRKLKNGNEYNDCLAAAEDLAEWLGGRDWYKVLDSKFPGNNKWGLSRQDVFDIIRKNDRYVGIANFEYGAPSIGIFTDRFDRIKSTTARKVSIIRDDSCREFIKIDNYGT